MFGLKELLGFEIQARDDLAGRVSDFLIDERAWTVGYAAVPVGGILSGEHRCIDVVRLTRDASALTSSFTLSELNAMSPRDLVPEAEEGWATAPDQTPPRVPTSEAPPERRSPWRSFKAMLGCDISASDGVYGTLDDLLVDPARWSIQYFVGRSYSWKKKPSVLIPTAWVEQVSSQGATVDVSVSKEALEREPSYKPSSHSRPQ